MLHWTLYIILSFFSFFPTLSFLLLLFCTHLSPKCYPLYKPFLWDSFSKTFTFPDATCYAVYTHTKQNFFSLKFPDLLNKLVSSIKVHTKVRKFQTRKKLHGLKITLKIRRLNARHCHGRGFHSLTHLFEHLVGYIWVGSFPLHGERVLNEHCLKRRARSCCR